MATLTCLQCGKEFEVNPVDVRRGRKFCSTECRYENKRRRVVFNCVVCGKLVSRRRSDYEKNNARNNHFCSKKCVGIWTSRNLKGENSFNYGRKFSSVHKEKIGNAQLGEKAHNWKGGRKVRKTGRRTGYIEVLIDGKYVQEHRHVAEKALGRPLKSREVVHHINGDRSDNRNCNLLICDKGYHQWLERKMAFLYKQEHFSHI